MEVMQVEFKWSGYRVPVIDKLHQRVARAVTTEGNTLNMCTWHGYDYDDGDERCGTTHCRGGWAIALCGNEGFDLVDQVGGLTSIAAHLIYAANTDLSISEIQGRHLFYMDNEEAMEDILRCAAEEAEKYGVLE